MKSSECGVRWGWRLRSAMSAAIICVAAAGPVGAQPAPKAKAPDLKAERALAATVSETTMVETVRRLVGFGTRMYGTPSNDAAAAWLAGEFREPASTSRCGRTRRATGTSRSRGTVRSRRGAAGARPGSC